MTNLPIPTTGQVSATETSEGEANVETRSRQPDGFTVVEVVVAMTVLVIALLGAALLFEKRDHRLRQHPQPRRRRSSSPPADSRRSAARPSDPTKFTTIAVGQTVYVGAPRT